LVAETALAGAPAVSSPYMSEVPSRFGICYAAGAVAVMYEVFVATFVGASSVMPIFDDF